ncbi:MAG: hypothetical protein ACO21B_12820, partial [Gemmobacter sp.]
MARTIRTPPDDALEAALRLGGAGPVAGVDEVGRGPLAGPVVAAAVVFGDAPRPPGIQRAATTRPCAITITGSQMRITMSMLCSISKNVMPWRLRNCTRSIKVSS